MVTGFGLATLLLSTPAAIVVYFVYSFVLPALFAIGSEFLSWFADIAKWIDFGGAQAYLAAGEMNGDAWAHLAVSGTIWLAIPLALGLWRVLRAEVK
jgi:ABC-2 type transport system permease protein